MTTATRAHSPTDREPVARFAYRPALDGLRALAVLAVMAYHQFPSQWASGGFLGVDVFFVLSGYLITSILLTEHQHAGGIDLVRFWGRRARRLLPAIGIFLLLVAGYAAFIAPPYLLGRLRSDSLATLFYVENYWQARKTFAPLPLGHMWSLSVEEQFYLVWPIALVGLLWLSRGRSRRLLISIVALATASAAAMALVYSPSNYGYIYVATEMRTHELLIGAALAVMYARGWRPTSPLSRFGLELAGIAGLIAFAVLIWGAGIQSSWLYRGGYALVAIGAAIVIAAAVQPTSPVLRRLLSLRLFVAIGMISYGLYLFHEPIYFVLAPERLHLSEWPLFAVRLAATFGVAIASFFFVERPVRTSRASFKVLVALAIPAAAAVVAVVVLSTEGAAPLNAGTAEAVTYSQLAAAAPLGATKVLVVGDALATSMQADRSTFAGLGIYGTANADWCNFQTSELALGRAVFASPKCLAPLQGPRGAIDGFQPDATVLMIGTQEVLDRVDRGKLLTAGSPASAAFLDRQLERARVILTATGAPMLLATVPCMRIPLLGSHDLADQARRIAWVNAEFRRFARDHSDTVRIIEFGEFLCDGAARRVVAGRSWGAPNGVGLSPTGAHAAWQWLAPLVRSERASSSGVSTP
jgi:peptidoglycan/LPS O-acetylase OafA/YrhL